MSCKKYSFLIFYCFFNLFNYSNLSALKYLSYRGNFIRRFLFLSNFRDFKKTVFWNVNVLMVIGTIKSQNAPFEAPTTNI